MLADRALIRSQGPLIGFTPLVWMVVLLKAFGGLLVAAVVKCVAREFVNAAIPRPAREHHLKTSLVAPPPLLLL